MMFRGGGNPLRPEVRVQGRRRVNAQQTWIRPFRQLTPSEQDLPGDEANKAAAMNRMRMCCKTRYARHLERSCIKQRRKKHAMPRTK